MLKQLMYALQDGPFGDGGPSGMSPHLAPLLPPPPSAGPPQASAALVSHHGSGAALAAAGGSGLADRLPSGLQVGALALVTTTRSCCTPSAARLQQQHHAFSRIQQYAWLQPGQAAAACLQTGQAAAAPLRQVSAVQHLIAPAGASPGVVRATHGTLPPAPPPPPPPPPVHVGHGQGVRLCRHRREHAPPSLGLALGRLLRCVLGEPTEALPSAPSACRARRRKRFACAHSLSCARVLAAASQIEGSTLLSSAAGPGLFGRLQEIHDNLMREMIAKHGGLEVGTEGDRCARCWASSTATRGCSQQSAWMTGAAGCMPFSAHLSAIAMLVLPDRCVCSPPPPHPAVAPQLHRGLHVGGAGRGLLHGGAVQAAGHGLAQRLPQAGALQACARRTRTAAHGGG